MSAAASGRAGPSVPIGSCLLLRQLELDHISLDPGGVAADLDARVVGPRAVGQPEAPGVPRAGDDVALDVPACERRPHVRAGVVDRLHRVALAEDGDQLALDAERLALALLQVSQPADGL